MSANDAAPPDEIDAALGLGGGSPLDALRRRREDVRAYSQSSWKALFEPSDFGDLSAQERLALAKRVAEISASTPLVSRYQALLASAPDASERLEAILAYADKITAAPSAGRPEDLAALAAAGLSPAAIVTLSQILGFVAYQARVVASLALLETSA